MIPPSKPLSPHPYPGKLIVVEGIDGSGKSTQLSLLRKWLESREINVFFTEWNSSELVKDTTRRGKKTKVLTPLTFSLLHATDFANRLYHQILPPLKAGMIVLADRYMYTAFARDAARGISQGWVRRLYSFAVRPDLVFYFRVPIEVSVARLLSGTRAELKYYEAGMDLGLSPNLVESFKLFQSRVLTEYDKIVDEFGLTVMDAMLEIDEQQEQVRDIVSKTLASYKSKRGMYAKREALFWRRFALPESEGTQGEADRH
jgi:dTMP kinase